MKIACVLITHLPIKAELRRHPELQNKPVIIAQELGSRRVVLDWSPQARGVAQGMPLQEALSLSKDSTLLEADEPYYQEAFSEILDSLAQRSPLVEGAVLGCAYVGLDGLELMYSSEARLTTALLQAVHPVFNPRVGVAQGKFPAYLAAIASGPGRATRVSEEVAEFLAGFSVNLLPLSWESKTRLRRFGLHTLGQVAGLSPGSMQAQFGVEGLKAWQLANGIDHSPLVPRRFDEVISESLTFPSPTGTLSAILIGIEFLLVRAFSRPEVRGKYARSIIIEGNILHHSPWVRQFPFKEAVGNTDWARSVIKNALEPVQLPGPLEDMKLTLAGLTGQSGIQSSLFPEVRKREQLRETVRQLEVQLGCPPPIFVVRDLEPWSRIPERRQVLVQFDP
jgi:DNA polymerase IV